ncbi:50S ribosomal protein L2 [Candidatus Woesearchaeota archaeon]|nr:50S ribosomal protein L2 [Candidatus Woesearchaeota archaeon]
MGKRIISQRRGRGTTTYRSHSFRWKTNAKYRIYDDIEKTGVIYGKVKNLCSDSGHSAPLALIKYENSEELYLIVPQGMQTESRVASGANAPIETGNVVPLKSLPEGAAVYNLEIKPGDGGKLVRSAGTAARVLTKSPTSIVIELPSKKQKSFLPECRATVGVVAGSGKKEKPFVKAGVRHHLMRARGKLYPRTSGVAMNAVDHPFGSGRGRHIGKSQIAPRFAPPGRKVGMIRARRTGRKKK